MCPGQRRAAPDFLRTAVDRGADDGSGPRGTNLSLTPRDSRTEESCDCPFLLPDSKTGPRAMPLGEAARALIEVLPGGRCPDAVWSYPVFVDSLGLSPPALSWATAGGRKVFPKIGG